MLKKLVRSVCFLIKYNFLSCFVLILVLKHEKYQYFFEKPKFENIENKHG